jgi:rod shape-determining protein MreD
MSRFFFPVLSILMFYSESVFTQLVGASAFQGDHLILVPRFLMVVLIMATFYYRPRTAIYYGIFFGFIYDLFFTDVLGIYMFIMPLILYIASKLMKILLLNAFVVTIILMFSLSLFEWIIYLMNVLIQKTDISFMQFVDWRLLPSLLLNLVFFIFIYFPLKKDFSRLQKLYSN